MKKFLLLILIGAAITCKVSAQTYPLVSIHDLQFVNDQNLAMGNDSSIHFGDTVQVEGIVTFNPCAYGLSTTGSRVGTWLQEPGGGPWSAIHVLLDPVATDLDANYTLDELDQAILFKDNFVVGYTVKATGIVSDFNHNSQILLLPIQSEITSIMTAMPAPAILPIDTFSQLDINGNQVQQLVTGEKYEGVYVQFDNVMVVDVSANAAGRIFWTLQDPQGNKIKIRDVSGYVRNDTSDNFCTSSGSYTPALFDTPLVNTSLAYVRGIIVENKPSNSPYEFNIAPLEPSDIGPVTASSPVITNVIEAIPVPTTSQAQTITAKITDADGTVSSATLYYNIGLTGSSFTAVTMTMGANDIWTAIVPAMGPDSTYIKYYIQANDNDGNITYFPNQTGTNSYYLILNSGVNSISDIQYNPLGLNDSPYRNTHITGSLAGTVMATTALNDLGFVVLQDGNNPWSGISFANNVNVVSGPNAATLDRGDNVLITSVRVFEDFGVTKLDSISYTVTSTNNPLPVSITSLSLDSVRLGVYGYTEPYESMLLEYNNVFVNSTNPDAATGGNFGEWSIANSAAAPAGLRVDDYSNDVLPHGSFNTDSMTLGEQLAYIKGILTFSFGNWKLLPRNKDDIDGFFTVNGISSVGSYHVFDVYPNPAENELRIRFTGNISHQADWMMTDITGRVINHSTLNTNTDYIVPVENLSSGVYFIHVLTNEGSQTVRFVKQ